MQILYFDESGDLGPLLEGHAINMQPIFALGSVLVPQRHVSELTYALMGLKQKHLGIKPVVGETFESLRREVKGKSLRKEIRAKGNYARRQLMFLDELLGLLKVLDCKILASIYVKSPNRPFDGRAVYTTAIQQQVAMFQRHLAAGEAQGLVIADSRYSHLNSFVSHSILTQQFTKFRKDNRLIENPVFGNSHNHAGLQVADFLISSLIVPLALATYCQNLGPSSFNFDFDHALKLRYASRLKHLQLVVKAGEGHRYGIFVNDALNGWDSSRMFIHTGH